MPSTNIAYPVWSVGRRKNATARVRLIPGSGKLVINNKNMEEYFGGHARAKYGIMKSFEVAKVAKQFDIWIDVQGGGVTGQAGAIAHGVARIFSKLDNSTRIAMRKEGLLTRDPRMVERKKPGRPKARKRFQYSKR